MSVQAARERSITAEEFWSYCAGKDGRLELADGSIVEMAPVGPLHGGLDSNLGELLNRHAREQQLGRVYVNTGFILRRSPDVVRGPDQAFVSTERMRDRPPPARGFWEVAPDLVVEIVSPDDTADEINQKVREYLAAGTRLVWVVYPRQRQVNVYRASGDVRILFEEGTLDGEDVLPGFRAPLAGLWD